MGCHSNESSCCSNQECQCQCACCSGKQSCSSGHEDGYKWFLEVADEAWTEVLKEKIKEHILATQKDRMTDLAKLVSEGNNQRWKSKMDKKKVCAEFSEKLHHFFSQGKK